MIAFGTQGFHLNGGRGRGLGFMAHRACGEIEGDAKGSYAEYVGNVVGVPALGEHGHRDDAAHPGAQAAGFTHGVHHFPEEFLVADGLAGVGAVGSADPFPMVLGRPRGWWVSESKFQKSFSLPFTSVEVPSPFSRENPET